MQWHREQLAGIGSLPGGPRLELIEGELLTKTGKPRSCANAVSLLLEALIQIFGFRFVQQEVPIDVAPEDLPTSEPEPDLIVLSCPLSAITASNPKPSELRLVIEVSDSTLGFDTSVKARLYARALIAEYWVLDVSGKRLIVFRYPASGKYSNVEAYDATESVAPLAAPDKAIAVQDLFPA